MQGIVGHTEEMAPAAAVGRTEPRHAPFRNLPQRRGDPALQIVARPDRQCRVILRCFAQRIDVPVMLLDDSSVPLDPLRKIHLRRADIKIISFPEPDLAQTTDQKHPVPHEANNENIAPAVMGFVIDHVPGDLDRVGTRGRKVVIPFDGDCPD